jgi:tRNA A-37 threonylcarbamoyl transferase component Bud32
MRAIAVAVVQADDDADPRAALAAVPDAAPYLVRAPHLGYAPPPAQVVVVEGEVADRAAAADLVRRAAGARVVVVLHAGDLPTPELAAALAAIAPDDAPRAFAAARVHRFLGRDVSGEPVVVAWRGEPRAAAATVELPGRLVTVEPDIATAIARLDRAATRAARARASVGVGDFVARPAGALLRRLWIRRRDGVPGVVLAVLETYGDVLTAAKVWEREERAAARRVTPSVRRVPAGFTAIDTRMGFVVARDDLRDAVVRALLDATPEIVDGELLNRAGRGATWAITLAGDGRAVLRWYRRGGVLRHFIRDRYFGWRPRPLAELVLTAEARRRGIAVPEVLGVRVDRVPGGYRGAIVTREIAGAETLGDVVRRDPRGDERAAIVAGVARAVRVMHDRGLHHRDLNVGNILLSRARGTVDVHVIDLDRARLRDRVARRARRRALRRLARSLAKLETPERQRGEDHAAFHRAYRERV